MTRAYTPGCTRRLRHPSREGPEVHARTIAGPTKSGTGKRIVAGTARTAGRSRKEPDDDLHPHSGSSAGDPRTRPPRGRPGRRRRQGVRQGRGRGPRPRRRDRGLRHRSLHRDHGPLGLGQVDAPARGRRPRHAHRRHTSGSATPSSARCPRRSSRSSDATASASSSSRSTSSRRSPRPRTSCSR